MSSTGLTEEQINNLLRITAVKNLVVAAGSNVPIGIGVGAIVADRSHWEAEMNYGEAKMAAERAGHEFVPGEYDLVCREKQIKACEAKKALLDCLTVLPADTIDGIVDRVQRHHEVVRLSACHGPSP